VHLLPQLILRGSRRYSVSGQDSPCYCRPQAQTDRSSAAIFAGRGPVPDRNHDHQAPRTAAAAQWQSNDRRALAAQFLNSGYGPLPKSTMGVGSDLSEYNTFPPGVSRTAIAQRSSEGGMQNERLGLSFNNGSNGYNPLARQSAQLHYDSDGVFGSGISLFQAPRRTGSGGTRQRAAKLATLERSTHARSMTRTSFRTSHQRQVQPDATLGHQSRRPICEDTNIHSTWKFRAQFCNRKSTTGIPVIIPQTRILSARHGPVQTRWSPTRTQYFADPRFTFWRNAMDHIEESRGHGGLLRATSRTTF
jgi:hypothetical protein